MGPFTVPSGFTKAPTLGLLKRKIAGATAETGTGCCTAPKTEWTVKVWVAAVRLAGTIAFIWKGDEETTVAGMPSKSSVVGAPGPERPAPNTAISPLGAMPAVKLAALTTAADVKAALSGVSESASWGRVAR